jgi:hypothetical protein
MSANCDTAGTEDVQLSSVCFSLRELLVTAAGPSPELDNYITLVVV